MREIQSLAHRWEGQPVISILEVGSQVRVALILQAYMAMPSDSADASMRADASLCKDLLKEWRQRTAPNFSAAQPEEISPLVKELRRLTATNFSAAQPEEISTRPLRAEQPDVSHTRRWHSKLQAMGLHIKPVAGHLVFHHVPSKSILKETSQEQVLRRHGAFHHLHLGSETTKPWGRFFMFDKHFVEYNQAGMQAEDPNAHKWSASKLWIDYTPYVSGRDWERALLLRIQMDRLNAEVMAFSHKVCLLKRAWFGIWLDPSASAFPAEVQVAGVQSVF